MKIEMVIIDPQVDFASPKGSLYVPKGDVAMDRLSQMVERLYPKLNDIHITLDSHHAFDIAHPTMWRDASGRMPDPFTLISSADIRAKKWMPYMLSMYDQVLDYAEKLEKTGKYVHTIWPKHCLIGTEGHNVWPNLMNAVSKWTDRGGVIDFVAKGTNVMTEHFSAVKAEVPDPLDMSTQTNMKFIERLEEADILLLAGLAETHCVLATVEDIANGFKNQDFIKKMVLVTDATAPVPDPPAAPGLFSNRVKKFMKEMTARGMKTTTSDTFLI